MACFIVPAAEAAVSYAVARSIEKKEKNELCGISENGITDQTDNIYDEEHRIPFSRKVKWLTKLLSGGSLLLAYEHVWHGEVTPFFPFLTAMNDPAETSAMLHEMGTVGVSMALLITVFWGGMLLVSNAIEKRAIRDSRSDMIKAAAIRTDDQDKDADI